MMTSRLVFFVCVLCLNACYSMHNGQWAAYERATFLHMQSPSRESDVRLEDALNKAMKRSKPLPGLSAEYGYFLYRQGKIKQAMYYFQQEKRLWPESAPMMDIVMQRIRENGRLEPIP